MTRESTSKGTAQRSEPLCLILADDLTGACDAAAPFASRGLQPEVSLTSEPQTDAPVLALNTNSRELPECEALTRVRHAVGLWQSAMPAIFLKKVDSVFRGNTFVEIHAMTALFPDRITLLAPSYPAAGRRVRNGCLLLENSDVPCFDIAGGLRSRGMHPVLLKAEDGGPGERTSLSAAIAEGHTLILCDAETSSELETLVSAGLSAGVSLGREVLWIGSGGLAHALSDALPLVKGEIDDEPLHAKTLFFCIGSDHSRTRQQVEHICQSYAMIRVQKSGEWPQAGAITLQSAHLLWEIGCEPLSVSAIQMLSRHLRQLLFPALFLSGGETAMRICQALGVRSISLHGELLPGVPWGILQGGLSDGIPIITKSGGFGEADTLTLLAEICSRTRGRRQSCR